MVERIHAAIARLSREPCAVSPDGERYLALARGEQVARPYHYRWLVPRLLGPDTRRWQWARDSSHVFTFGATYSLARSYGAGRLASVAAGALTLACPGVGRISSAIPVLVDPPALAAATTSAAVLRRHRPLGVGLSLLAGTVKESAPVYAAAYSLRPEGLFGLISPAVRHLQEPGTETDPTMAKVLADPWGAGHHDRAYWANWRWLVAPWGFCLVALLARGSVAKAALAACVVSYAQLLVATDCVRLYQQAAPAVAIAAAKVMDGHPLALGVSVIGQIVGNWGRGD